MLAIIGGTGFNQLKQAHNTEQDTAAMATPYGNASTAPLEGRIEGVPVRFLARHGSPHRIPPHKINYRANIWALKQLGVTKIWAVNAVGGIATAMTAGAIVIPDQLVDFSYGREHTFYDGFDYGAAVPTKLEHVDFSYPFSEGLRQALIDAASQLSLPVFNRAVYGVTQGPRLETAAEINALARAGCDVVGMTAMPEAGLARELGMDYASICLVVNPAAGRGEGLITMDDIHRVIDAGMIEVQRLIGSAIQLL